MNVINTAMLVIAFVAPLCSSPVKAEQLRFTGHTTANLVLIKDTLRHIQLVGQGQKHCGTISSVEASVLPEDYLPSDTAYRVGVGRVIYERWSVDLCGEAVQFLISFWPAADGGALFAVGYPYPADVP